jgi:hypothetical protein
MYRIDHAKEGRGSGNMLVICHNDTTLHLQRTNKPSLGAGSCLRRLNGLQDVARLHPRKIDRLARPFRCAMPSRIGCFSGSLNGQMMVQKG